MSSVFFLEGFPSPPLCLQKVPAFGFLLFPAGSGELGRAEPGGG